MTSTEFTDWIEFYNLEDEEAKAEQRERELDA